MKCLEINFLLVKQRRHCNQWHILKKSSLCSCENSTILYYEHIATLAIKVRGLLDVSDFPGRIRACERDGSRFPIPLQLLSGEHLRLPVRVNQGADLCWHLWVTGEKPEKRFMTSFHLFLHKRAHLKRNLEAFFLWFKIGNLECRFERANLEVSPTSLATSMQSS